MSDGTIPSFIPDAIGGKSVLFEDAPVAGTVELSDSILTFGPAFLFLMFGEGLFPEQIVFMHLPTTAGLAFAGILSLLAKPQYKTVYGWVSDYYEFRGRPTEKEKRIQTDGGKPIKSKKMAPDADTRELTNLKKLHPYHNAVELDDGTMAAIIEFTGSNMELTSANQKRSVVKSYTKSISEIKNPIQFYFPMRNVSLGSTIDKYDGEKSDSEFMREYKRDRVSWLKGIESGSYVRRSYVIVTVRPSEVYTDNLPGQGSGIEQAPGGEIIKDFKRILLGSSDIKSDRERRERQYSELDERTDRIKQILKGGPGNESERLNSDEIITLYKEYWEGTNILEENSDAVSRNQPLVS